MKTASVVAARSKLRAPAKPAVVQRAKPIKPVKALPNMGKQRLNVTVRSDLIERAREYGMNLSSVLEEGLTERLRKSEGERWLAENAEALAYHRARIERDGPLNADLVSF